ncbi:MAG: TIGR03746 family integrating conjugative element protein [Acidobacteria bacterium]|nr:TIGR03746 family integrating conjugative element protein [Acidobacteriota bacterium]
MYRDVVKAQRAHIKTLYGIGGILFLGALFNGAGWYAATRELPSIGVRPDLSRFATLRPGEYHPHEIYGFAQAIWQGLNRWPQDGQKEYAENLYRFQAYLTPDFYAERDNPWGLGLDGFAEQGYYRLEPETARAEVSLR